MTKTKPIDTAFQNQIDNDNAFTCEKPFDPKYVEIGKCCMFFLELYNISLMMSLIVLQAADFDEQQTMSHKTGSSNSKTESMFKNNS